jgi:uncharacterized membrane protein
MEKVTKTNLKPTRSDKIIEITGYVVLLAFWITIIISYKDLPEQIPIHYNALGEVDNYGNKTSIFILPIIGTFLFVFLTLTSKNPENFSYSIKITAENAERQYKNAVKMMGVMKIIVIILFFLIEYETITISNKKSEGLGVWFLPIMLGLIFVPVIYFAYRSHKIK